MSFSGLCCATLQVSIEFYRQKGVLQGVGKHEKDRSIQALAEYLEPGGGESTRKVGYRYDPDSRPQGLAEAENDPFGVHDWRAGASAAEG